MVEGQLTLEEFARLTAKIDSGEPVERVLSETELDREQWAQAQASWLKRMAKRAAEGKPSLHKRFIELLADNRRQVEAVRRAEKRLDGPLPESPKERKAPVLAKRRPRAPRAAAPIPQPAARPRMPPNGQVPPPRPAGPPPVEAARAATGAMRAIPSEAALPFGDERSVMPFAGASAARAGHPSPLPFRPDAEAKPPPPVATEPEPPLNLGATMAMSAEDFASARAALLPFLQPQTKGTTDGEASASLGSTSYLSPEEFAKARAALPFGAPPPAESDAGSDEGDDTAELPPRRSDAVSGETAELPPDRPPSGTTLPFQAATKSDAPAQPTLSLEQYAWLCATIERSAARIEETLAWLRMSAEQKAQLDAQWREAMARDRSLAERFEALRRSYSSKG